MRPFKINSLSNSQLNIIINYSHHGIHHIPTTCLFHNQKNVFWPPLPISLIPPNPNHLPLATTNLRSVPMSLVFVFQIPHVFVPSYSICLSLTYFTYIMPSRSTHAVANGSIFFFLWLNTTHCVSLCVYIRVCVCVCVCVCVAHFLYPFTHQWTFRLLPCLSYCK